jgi:hypothetical protein
VGGKRFAKRRDHFYLCILKIKTRLMEGAYSGCCHKEQKVLKVKFDTPKYLIAER